MNWLIVVVKEGPSFGSISSHPDKASAIMDGEQKYLELRTSQQRGYVYMIPARSVYELTARNLVEMSPEDRQNLGIQQAYMVLGWE